VLFAELLCQSTSFISSVLQNPEWREVAELKNWYATKGRALLEKGSVAMLTTPRGGGGQSAA
jgi:hypothetical protein